MLDQQTTSSEVEESLKEKMMKCFELNLSLEHGEISCQLCYSAELCQVLAPMDKLNTASALDLKQPKMVKLTNQLMCKQRRALTNCMWQNMCLVYYSDSQFDSGENLVLV